MVRNNEQLWTDRRTNQSILAEILPKEQLLLYNVNQTANYLLVLAGDDWHTVYSRVLMMMAHRFYSEIKKTDGHI